MQKSVTSTLPNDSFALQGTILDDSTTSDAVATMLEVFESCLGPHGQCKLIHNDLGGHVTVTSSSERLLRTVQTSSPVLKLIIIGVQQHLASFSDGGAVATSLALQIITRARRLDINRQLITEIAHLVAQECIYFVHSEACACRVRISLDNLDHMLQIVHGITSTKPGCCASRKEVQQLDRCIVETFLKTFPSNSKTSDERVQYLCIEGKPVRDSYVIDGMLIETISIPTYKQSKLELTNLDSGSRSEKMATAVFNISLAGDMEDIIDAVFEASTESHMQDAILEQLLTMGEKLIKSGVGAVFCQKVIHPKLKQIFRECGILTVDRLGLTLIKQVHTFAGGTLLSSTFGALDISDFGCIRSILHRVINNRSYLHFQSCNASVCYCTFVLCGSSEESVNELKHVCSVGLHVLRQSVAAGIALKGGGLWQLELSNHLKALPVETVNDWSSSLECSKPQIRSVLTMLAECYERLYDVIAKGPAVSSKFSCDDGLRDVNFKQTAVVLDALAPASSAVSTAMFLSSMVLGIHQYISSTN